MQLKKSLLGLQPLLMVLGERWPPVVPTQGEKSKDMTPVELRDVQLPTLHLLIPIDLSASQGRSHLSLPSCSKHISGSSWIWTLHPEHCQGLTAKHPPPATRLPSLQLFPTSAPWFPPVCHFLPRNDSKALLPELMFPLKAVVEPKFPHQCWGDAEVGNPSPGVRGCVWRAEQRIYGGTAPCGILQLCPWQTLSHQ